MCSRTPRTSMRYMARISSQTRKRIRNSGTSAKMQKATTALSAATTSRNCGIVSPAGPSSSTASAAATAMKSALTKWLAASTRPSSVRGERCWTSAYSGTMKKPADTPISTRSSPIRQKPGLASTSGTASGSARPSATRPACRAGSGWAR